MATIKLMYIDGISRIDTPYFSTISSQESYFGGKVVATIDNTFYPPHYQNSIRIDSEDADFNKHFNYIALVFKTKTYYYFVDSVDYSSEDVIIVHITMDTIQTYMFDITIASGIIERKFINRWKNIGTSLLPVWTINRNYLRENISKGEFEVDSLNSITMDYWVVLVTTRRISSISGDGTFQYYAGAVLSKVDEHQTPYYYYFMPLSKVTSIVYGGASHTVTGQGLLRLFGCSYVVDAYVLPYCPITGVTISDNVMTVPGSYDNDGRTYNLDTTLAYLAIISYVSEVGSAQGSGWWQSSYSSIVKTAQASYTFSRNTVIAMPFYSYYMAMLFDENYLRFEFGNLYNVTTFPLHYLETTSFRYVSKTSIDTGLTTVYVDKLLTSEHIKYNSIETVTNKLYIDLINDKWQDYISNNRNRWMSATLKTGLDVANMFVSPLKGSLYKDMDLMYLADNIRITKSGEYDKRFTKSLSKMDAVRREWEKEKVGYNFNAMQPSGNFINQFVQDANMQYAPASKQQSNTLFEGISSKYYNLFTRKSKVRDYEQCAQYYHRNGYKVDEYVTNMDTIFSYVNTRLYYNMLKMSIPEVHLKNVVEDIETCELIAERLVAGVRLWNVTDSRFISTTGMKIGNFAYDNVEGDFI